MSSLGHTSKDILINLNLTCASTLRLKQFLSYFFYNTFFINIYLRYIQSQISPYIIYHHMCLRLFEYIFISVLLPLLRIGHRIHFWTTESTHHKNNKFNFNFFHNTHPISIIFFTLENYFPLNTLCYKIELLQYWQR